MPPARFERTTPGLGILCSIHLSYGGIKENQALTGITQVTENSCVHPVGKLPYHLLRRIG
jgi:hypothetical protein